MYLKEDSLFMSVGPVNGYKYTQDYNEPLHASETLHAYTQALAQSQAQTLEVESTLLVENNIEPEKKCLFYTFFFGIIGYLLYYIFKDTI
jgi:hypothetical protein